jgi:hypothetical protein
VTDDAASQRRRRLTSRKFDSAAEADRHDLAWWRAIPAEERILLAWRLSEEQWRLSGNSEHEPGLSRSVARVRRR